MTEDIVAKALATMIAGILMYVFTRWANKLNVSLDTQAVVNAKVSGALDLVAERLNGHCLVADTRHEALKDRLGLVERDVARHRK